MARNQEMQDPPVFFGQADEAQLHESEGNRNGLFR
jgi:hypothetical protein